MKEKKKEGKEKERTPGKERLVYFWGRTSLIG